MEKERHRRKVSTGQIGLKRTTAGVFTTLKCEPRPNDFLSVNHFSAQDNGVIGNNINEHKARDRSKVDHKEDVVANSSEDLKNGTVAKRSIQARSLPRTLFVKRSDQSYRYDIGVSVTRHRLPQEINTTKQSQFINNSASVSGRRMSSPGIIIGSSANEQISGSKRIVTALERQTKQVITETKYPSETGKESSDSLPKITKSLETLTTEDHMKRSKSLDEGRKIVIKTSKWSPQSVSSDKSTDRTQGLLEAKIIPERRATTPKTPTLERGDDDRYEMENYDKIVQPTRFENKETKTTFPAPIDLVGDYSSWKAKEDRGSKGGSESVDLVKSQIGLVEKPNDVACEGKKRHSQGRSPRRKITFNSKVKVDHRPRSRIPPQKHDSTAVDALFTVSNPEDELIDLKVKAFLRKHQPKASHGSLKVKASKHKRPLHPANKLRERRSYERIVINTDTCPSSNIVTQDRSWYYQDRTGKCRYLRVPESPVPPVEWVFKRTPSP